MATIFGNTSGLKKKTIYDLERIYRRKIPSNRLITPELARYLTDISHEVRRQVGILVTREGAISHVMIGDSNSMLIPVLTEYPLGRKTLRGLRFIHTHLQNEPLTNDDLTDLALLRLDFMAAIGIKNGLPDKIFTAHLMPQGSHTLYEISREMNFYNYTLDFETHIHALEEEMQRERVYNQQDRRERAILISVSTKPKYEQEESLDELEELCKTSNVVVLDKAIQRPKKINPKYVMGIGKLKELIINALNKGATLVIFDQDLSPSQGKAIADLTELKVIDRSQLILDIFARRAHSRDGKVQVELAQLKYMLPRLTGKGTAMSRLTGGIGGRGPGEMKLEIDRRRVRDRIHLLEKELTKLARARQQRKQSRVRSGIPIVSIIGYTNAGKSTLLNSLTKSETSVEDKMFATLDTSSRRLRFPNERDVIITDTVGFIRDLPDDLMAAFKATLEELEDADLLLHIVDASNPRFEQHIESVGNIMKDLNLHEKPCILIFNKMDKISVDELNNLIMRYHTVAISALDTTTFGPLLKTIEERIFYEKMVTANTF